MLGVRYFPFVFKEFARYKSTAFPFVNTELELAMARVGMSLVDSILITTMPWLTMTSANAIAALGMAEPNNFACSIPSADLLANNAALRNCLIALWR